MRPQFVCVSMICVDELCVLRMTHVYDSGVLYVRAHDLCAWYVSNFCAHGMCPGFACPLAFFQFISTIGVQQARRRTRFARREGWTSSRRYARCWSAREAPVVSSGFLSALLLFVLVSVVVVVVVVMVMVTVLVCRLFSRWRLPFLSHVNSGLCRLSVGVGVGVWWCWWWC